MERQSGGLHDRVLRGTGWRGRKEIWKGCQAGMQAIGIEANGRVKGCLSLQARQGDHDPFVEGNLRETRLADLWYRIASLKREVQMDYGVMPDTIQPADTKPDTGAINCDEVCCECEYGVIPEDVWKECCDPCKDVCCDCDYGEPPPGCCE